MENLTSEQWHRVFEVMQKEARHQKAIIENPNLPFTENMGGRPKALRMANEISKIALTNAGGPK